MLAHMTQLYPLKDIGSKYMARDSWHSSILISGSTFIFEDEMNHFKYYLMSSAPCLKGFANTKL